MQFLTDAWEAYGLARGLKKYEMSGRKNALYFDLVALPNPNVSFIGIDGNNTYRALMGYRTRKTTRHSASLAFRVERTSGHPPREVTRNVVDHVIRHAGLEEPGDDGMAGIVEA